MSMKLQLKKDEGPEETNACPSCGANMPPSAVICIECGFDTRSGRRSGEEGRKKLSPMVVFSIVLAVVGIGATVTLRTLNSSSDAIPPPAPVAQATAAAPEPAPPPAQPDPTPQPTPEAEVAPDVAAADAEAQAEEPPAEPEVPAIDWAAVEAEQLEKATEELDRRAPMYEIGEAIELRMANGVVLRGVFKELRDGNLKLAVAEDDVRDVPVESLDRQNRVRTEANFRERYIEYAVKKRIAEMMQRAETNAP